MEINKEQLFKYFFAIAFFVSIVAATLKILHVEGSQTLFIIAVLSTAIYILLGVFEVNYSTKIKSPEKIMWTIGFIFLGFITGIIYLFAARKRIV